MPLKNIVRLTAFVATLFLACNLYAAPEVEKEIEEVFAPTTLIEISPEIASQYHRLIGKIEGGVADKKLSEELQSRLGEWVESAGSEKPQTFSAASASLLDKIKNAEQDFDKARSSGQLATWLSPQAMPSASKQGEAMPMTKPEEAKPQEISTQDQAVTETERPAQKGDERFHLPEYLKIAIVALAFCLIFAAYPKFIETEKEKFTKSLIGRFSTRVIYSGVASLLLGAFLP